MQKGPQTTPKTWMKSLIFVLWTGLNCAHGINVNSTPHLIYKIIYTTLGFRCPQIRYDSICGEFCVTIFAQYHLKILDSPEYNAAL